MGTPEWEELSINHDYGDDYRPHFAREDVGNYQRPYWFVSGPLSLSVKYLLAMRSEDRKQRDHLWALLERARLGEIRQASISAKMFLNPLIDF